MLQGNKRTPDRRLSMLLLATLCLVFSHVFALDGYFPSKPRGCKVEAYAFENYEDVNVQTLLFYNMKTSKPYIQIAMPPIPLPPPPITITTTTSTTNTTLPVPPLPTVKIMDLCSLPVVGAPSMMSNATDRLWTNNTHYGGFSWYDQSGRLHVPQFSQVDYFADPPLFGSFNGTTFVGYNGVPAVIQTNFTLPTAPYGCTLYVTARLSFRSLYPQNITSCAGRSTDPFYGVGFFGAIDWTNWIEFDFFLTNTRVYAVYTRWPNGIPLTLPPTIFYDAWVFMVPIGTREVTGFQDYSLAFDKRSGSVSWLVDNQLLLIINRIGLRLDKKFQTNQYFYDTNAPNVVLPYPKQLGFEIGVLVPDQTTLVQGACQGFFDRCLGDQTPRNAYRTGCRYIAPQPVSTFNVTLLMDVERFSVSQACDMATPCPCFAPQCSDEQDTEAIPPPPIPRTIILPTVP